MSSIERAIDKLTGEPTATDDEGKDEARADSRADAEAAAAGIAPPETESAAAATELPSAKEDGVAGAPAPAAAVTAAAAAPQPSTAPVPPVGDDVAVIDFERLAAAGHLIPDATLMTRESEEYQQIKRRLLGNIVEGILPSSRPANLIMVTSSLPSEGKTFTSVNLALSLTMEVDHTVLAVDTDIMKKDMSRAFGVEDRPGLYDLLGNESLRLEDLLVRTTIPNLVLLPVGQSREASTERLASAQMRALADEIATRYSDRVVLFDSPPILATTTAAALAPLVGQLVVVVEAARTKQETVRSALMRLEGVRVTGLILNKSRQPQQRDHEYYGYYYRTA